jgi:membrane peptidoglycan carboxypeptidase
MSLGRPESQLLTHLARIIARSALGGAWRELEAEIERRRVHLSGSPRPPLIARQLLVSGEDHRSGRHGGFDLHAMLRAVWRRLFYARSEGASTIEQQLVRVLTNRFERTFRRKLREILLASLVAERFAKTEIAGLYLSVAYYGWKMNCFLDACCRLGLAPALLSLDQAAELVARLKYPEPQMASVGRRTQIRRRCAHLLTLYEVHRSVGTYDHLNQPWQGEAVYGRAVVNRRFDALSCA